MDPLVSVAREPSLSGKVQASEALPQEGAPLQGATYKAALWLPHIHTPTHTCTGFHTYMYIHAYTQFQSMFHSLQVLKLSHGPHGRIAGMGVFSVAPSRATS